MKPTILVYEMLDEGRKKKLRQIGKGLQVQVRHIRPEHYGVPLQQILQLPQEQWRIEAASQALDARDGGVLWPDRQSFGALFI